MVLDNAGWSGFYGPSYRELLAVIDNPTRLASAWARSIDHHRAAPNGEEHWEFLATGYLHLVDTGGVIEDPHRSRLAELVHAFQKKTFTNNWRFMQKVVRRRLGATAVTVEDLVRAGVNQTSEGMLPDHPSEPSSQYHAYLLLLLLRFGDRRDPVIREAAKKAFDWLRCIDIETGDPSAIGRGRFQLFGYAAMAAAAHYASEYAIDIDGKWLSRVWARCIPERQNGAMSALWSGPFRELLLHGYNTLSDYPAFAQLWLSGLPSPGRAGSEEDSTYWLHTLPEGAGELVSHGNGVSAAILATPDHHTRTGGKAMLKAILSGEDRTLKKINTWMKILDGDCLKVGGSFLLTRSANKFSVRVDQQKLMRARVLNFPVLWMSKKIEVQCNKEGCVELSHLTWSRNSDELWRGYAARIVRMGNLEYKWSL